MTTKDVTCLAQFLIFFIITVHRGHTQLFHAVYIKSGLVHETPALRRVREKGHLESTLNKQIW
jgi:hypothetical protein